MDDKWIDNIREKMSEFEMTPPEGLWDSVQEGLNARKSRRWKLLPPAAIAASVALIIGLYIAFMPVSTPIADEPLLCLTTLGHNNTDGITDNESPAQDNPSYRRFNTGRKSLQSHIPTTEELSIATESMAAGVPSNADIREADSITASVPEPCLAENTPPDESDADKYELYAYNEPYGNLKEKRLSISVSASAYGMGGLINDNDFFNSQSHQMFAANINGSRMGGGIFSDSGSNNGPVAPEPSPVEIFDHKLPLRFSLNISLPLHRNLNMDTGVDYSYLRSDIKYGDANAEIWDGQQKLHYLGIPVSLRYTALSMHHCDFYVSGGAMVEKCIGGKIESDDRSGTPYSYHGCDDRPFQFSLNAAAGIQYNIAKGCGLYLEPGMGIYLDNGSRLRTIYNERPVTFNLNIGIRFSAVNR